MTTSSIPAGPRGFVESEGEQLYFESWGAGETVVLTHGMGGNHVVWYQQVAGLAADHQVVTWDQRGFGRSTNLTGAPGPESSVRDLAAILNHLEVEQAHLVGQSMGGWASLGFALAEPDRTRSLTLADTIGGIYTPRIRQSFLDYAEVIATSPPPSELPLGSHPAVGSQLAGEDLARSFLYSQIGGMGSPPPPDEITRLLLATDHTARLDSLRAPTLFVVGRNDPIFPPNIIHEAADLVAGSEVALIDATGHSPYFERPDEWNNVVADFVRRA